MINYEDIGALNCQPVNSFWKKFPALCEVTVWKPNISSMSILAAAVVASPAFKPFIQRPRSGCHVKTAWQVVSPKPQANWVGSSTAQVPETGSFFGTSVSHCTANLGF